MAKNKGHAARRIRRFALLACKVSLDTRHPKYLLPASYCPDTSRSATVCRHQIREAQRPDVGSGRCLASHGPGDGTWTGDHGRLNAGALLEICAAGGVDDVTFNEVLFVIIFKRVNLSNHVSVWDAL